MITTQRDARDGDAGRAGPVRRVSRLTVATAAILLTVGCAAATTQQKEDREYRRLVYEQKFKIARDRCWASGGRIVVFASQALDSSSTPRPGDRYVCN